ncbi:hypothetical protein ABID25_006631 [Mesorhizobium abyssinicae]
MALRRVVAAVTGIGEDALDLGTGGIFHRRNNLFERVLVVSVPEQEEAVLVCDPPMAVERQASAGDDAMQMDRAGSDPGCAARRRTRSLRRGVWVGSDGAQGLSGGTEEQAIHECLVLIGDGGEGAGQREYDVKGFCVEKFGATILQRLRATQ